MTPRILMLAQEDGALILLCEALQVVGFEVNSARTIGQALDSVEHAVPDVILLDSTREEEEGIGFCRTLKDKQLTSQVPIILLTRRGEVTHRIRGFQSGAEDCLETPCNLRELVLRINVVFRRHGWSDEDAAVAGSTRRGDLIVTTS